MSLRFPSLDVLGKGAWKVSSSTPYEILVAKKTHKGTQLQGPTPHEILWAAVSTRWVDAVLEFKHAVPGRKYRIDIAMPALALAIEVDGFNHHGKYLADFKRDRERQNLLTLHGWKILRFSAGEIRKDVESCVSMIEKTRYALLLAKDEGHHGG